MKKILFILLFLPLFTNAQIITTIAGNGITTNTGDGGLAVNAGFNLMNGVSFDNYGNLMICSGGSVRKLDTLTGILTLFAGDSLGGTSLGDDSLAFYAHMTPIFACVDNIGNTYISDGANNRIRKVDYSTGIITTVAGNGASSYSGDGGPATNASFVDVFDICLDTSGNLLYISDVFGSRVRKVSLSTGIITTYAGTGVSGYSGDGGPATNAKLSQVDGICLDRLGNLYMGDRSNGRIRKVNAVTGIITTFAGNGITGYSGDGGNADSAKFGRVSAMVFDSIGNLFFADNNNNLIRRIDAVTHIITRVAGNGPICPPPGGCGTFGGDGGPADSGYLHIPFTLCLDHSGNIYIGDYDNYRVRKVGYGIITPTFLNGAVQPLNICVTTPTTSINSLMAITDVLVGATEKWRVVTAPSHGTLGGFSTTAISTGGIVTPSGLTYTPAVGYTGTDVFTVQIANGQDSTITTINVNISALPSAITGTDTVCVGFSSALNATPAGGTWSSGSVPIAPVVYGTGVVTGVSAGTAIITYATAPGCLSTKYFTVNPLPLTITPTTVCNGASVTLSDSICCGTWSRSNGNVSIGAATGLVTGAAVGTSVITYTLPTGCRTTTTVTVVTSPSAIIGVTNVCDGLTTSLASTPAGGFWYSGNWPVAIVSGGGVVTTFSAGTADITYTLGSCSVSTPVTVYDMPAIEGNDTLCFALSTILNDGAPGGSWSSSNTSVATVSASGVVKGRSVGISVISYTLPSGCTTTATVTVKMCLAGVPEINSNNNITIFPNPAQNQLTIVATNNITNLTITDLVGRTVYTNNYNSDKVQVDIANLPKGIYIIKINGSEVRKFVKD